MEYVVVTSPKLVPSWLSLLPNCRNDFTKINTISIDEIAMVISMNILLAFIRKILLKQITFLFQNSHFWGSLEKNNFY